MKKVYKILTLPIIAASLPVTACTASLNVVNNNINEDRVVLSTATKYITAGEHLNIKVNNGAEDASKFTWTVESPTTMIYVVQTGVIFAAKELKIEDTISVKVKATDKSNPSRVGELIVDVVPTIDPAESNLLGFRNSSLEYVNIYGDKCQNRIIKKDQYTYVLEQPIDIVQNNPENYVFKIEPIVREGSSPLMQWWRTDGDETFLFMGYNEGHDTLTCPEIHCHGIRNLTSRIKVNFLCNGSSKKQPELWIDTNIWQNRKTSTVCMFSYLNESVDDKYVLENIDKGNARMRLFCPSNPSKSVYSHLLTNLYCFKDLHQYSNYHFDFVVSRDLPDKIRNAFSWKIAYTPTKRTFDNLPMYRISFWYGFDMSKMPSAKEMDYQNTALGQILALDEKESIEGAIEFKIDWI